MLFSNYYQSQKEKNNNNPELIQLLLYHESVKGRDSRLNIENLWNHADLNKSSQNLYFATMGTSDSSAIKWTLCGRNQKY